MKSTRIRCYGSKGKGMPTLVTVNKLYIFIWFWPSAEESNEAAKIHFSRVGLIEAERPRCPEGSFQRRTRMCQGYPKRNHWANPQNAVANIYFKGLLWVLRSQCFWLARPFRTPSSKFGCPPLHWQRAVNLFTRPGKLRTDSVTSARHQETALGVGSLENRVARL